MKTLIVVGHPDLSKSKLNKALIMEAQKHPEFTINMLGEKYKNDITKINVKEEQDLLIAHERIVLQFPFYWYSTPALLKSWIDAVFTFGFAYGEGGDKLRGKEIILSITTGGNEQAYTREGYNYFNVKELTTPLAQTMHLAAMNMLEPFLVQGAMTITDEELNKKAKSFVEYLKRTDLKQIKRTDWK